MTAITHIFRKNILGLPLTVLLIVFFALPMGMVFFMAFQPYDPVTMVSDGFTFKNITGFLADPSYLGSFVRTVWISAMSMLICMILGFPVAWHLHQTKSGDARLWLTLVVLLPLMVSLVVASFAWLLILGNNGLINGTLRSLRVIDRPINLVNTPTGVIIVTAFSHISYVILTTFAALENIDPALARAARIHGASEVKVFRLIILPLAIPGVIAGGLIVFSLSMAAFVIPYLIGGGRVDVVPLQIYKFTVQFFNWPGAAALGLLLLLLTLFCGFVISAIGHRVTPWEKRK